MTVTQKTKMNLAIPFANSWYWCPHWVLLFCTEAL